MVVLSGNSKSVPSLGAGFRPRDGLGSGYRARVNLITNVLAFGMPCTGKTHTLCAIGHRPVESEPNLIAQARFISERLLTLRLHNSASLDFATRVDRKRKNLHQRPTAAAQSLPLTLHLHPVQP